MIQVSNLKKSYAARTLFEKVSFSVSKGEIIGFVGRNGCGKSTLIKILLGFETSDEGDVSIPKGYRLGYLDQHIEFTEDTVVAECCKVLPEDQAYDQYKAEAYLLGLGFSKEEFDKHPSKFSGGYQLRINLVKALLGEPDLLLLDEPTNYLDILSLDWMRGFLKTFPGEVMIITHDRLFMDSVATHTMGLHRGNLKKIKGNTDKYYTQLMEEEEIYEKTRANQEKKIKQMERFVERFGAKASKATQAQSKQKQLNKMKVMSQLVGESSLGFQFNYKSTPAKTLATISELSFGFIPEEPLFENVEFSVKPGDRVAVIGPNGRGKTTLLNVLAGQLKGSGTIYFHPETTIGYYQQTNKKDLGDDMTVFEEIGSTNTQLGISEIMSICGAMMFSGDNAKKKIGVLSGGEQGRVLLGKVIAKKTNLLLLDEPTNHLDMESIQVMTEEIDAFPGGVILVSHDESLLRRLATHLVVFKNGKASLFLGTYDEFLRKEGWGELSVSKSKVSKSDRKEAKRKRAEIIQKKSRDLKPLKRELETLESEIIESEELIAEQNSKISSLPVESEEAKAAFKNVGNIQLKLVSKYQRMDEVVESITEIESEADNKLAELS